MDEFDFPISDIVKKDYRTADVFKKYQLSFCCSGAVPLKSACEARGIDFALISIELEESTRTRILPNNLRYEEWSIDFLTDFIAHIYHDYIYRVIPSLGTTLESFTLGHQSKFPELTRVVELFTKMTDLLMLHCQHEDEIIFPYIRQIDSAYRRKEPYGNLFVRTLRKPLDIVEKGQFQVMELLNDLKQATNQFKAPVKACLNHIVHYKKLEEAHGQLLHHQFLERTILFPKAIAIEQKLLQL